MHIKPFDRDIKNILEISFYKIPRFQRPYSWDKGNVEEFWADAIESEVPEYFIGSMVFFKHPKRDEHQVVDGQQRLTTITIILAAIRDALQQQGHESLAQGIQSVIQRKDINDQLRFVLQPETSYPYFQEHVQKFGQPEIECESGTEEQGIAEAVIYAREKMVTAVAALESDPTVKPEKKKELIRQKLLHIRDRLLSLRVIVVELDNEDDAYIIFETLNTRGKDLEPADLVKNHLTRLLPPKSADTDPAKMRWNRIVREFGESAAGIDINTFLHHFWLSRHDYTPAKTLFKKIKATVTKASAKQFLDDLVDASGLYRRIMEPASFKWQKEQQTIRRSLEALLIFRVRQPLPLVLAILRDYYDDKLSLKHARDALAAIESFHFIFTAMSSQSSSGGISFMYASTARDLCGASGDKKVKILAELRSKLRQRLPDQGIFSAGFTALSFMEAGTRQKPLVRYILGRLDAHFRPDKIANYDAMTIEHIAPQDGSSDPSLSEDDIGNIGNLIFVSEEVNAKLDNKPFVRKKEIMAQSGVPLDPVLKNAQTWLAPQIAKRGKDLAATAYSKIWKM